MEYFAHSSGTPHPHIGSTPILIPLSALLFIAALTVLVIYVVKRKPVKQEENNDGDRL